MGQESIAVSEQRTQRKGLVQEKRSQWADLLQMAAKAAHNGPGRQVRPECWLMEGLSVDQPKAHKPVAELEIV